MKAYSIKLKLRPPNKLKLSPIEIWYWYNREYKSFAVGAVVPANQVDVDKMRIKPTYPDATEIQNKIDTIKKRLLRIVADAPLGIEPTKTYVADMWNETIRQEIQEVQQAAIVEERQERSIRTRNKTGNLLLHFISTDLEQIKSEEEALKVKKATLYAEEEHLVKVNPNLVSPRSQVAAAEKLMYDEYIKYVAGKKCGKFGMAQYNSFGRIFFEEFRQSKSYKEAAKKGLSITFEGMSIDFYNTYMNYCFQERGYYDNTTTTHIKKLKAFLKYADTTLKYPVNKHYTAKEFKVYTEEIEDFVYLKPDEVDKVWQYQFDCADTITDRELKVLDVCVLGCKIGLRISEVIKQKLHVVDINNRLFLKGKTGKNDSRYLMPLDLSPYTPIILNKYNNDIRILSDVEFNRQIKPLLKKIFTYYNIPNPLITPVRHRFGKPVNLPAALRSDLYSSHGNRRGFITWTYYAGIDPKIIQLFIGTKTPAVLHTYIQKSDEGTAQLMQNIKL